MKRDLDALMKAALGLPPDARATLAGALIDSLDATVDDDVEAAWDAEIARRLGEIQAGQATLVPWTEVRRRLSVSSSATIALLRSQIVISRSRRAPEYGGVDPALLLRPRLREDASSAIGARVMGRRDDAVAIQRRASNRRRPAGPALEVAVRADHRIVLVEGFDDGFLSELARLSTDDFDVLVGRDVAAQHEGPLLLAGVYVERSGCGKHRVFDRLAAGFPYIDDRVTEFKLLGARVRWTAASVVSTCCDYFV